MSFLSFCALGLRADFLCRHETRKITTGQRQTYAKEVKAWCKKHGPIPPTHSPAIREYLDKNMKQDPQVCLIPPSYLSYYNTWISKLFSGPGPVVRNIFSTVHVICWCWFKLLGHGKRPLGSLKLIKYFPSMAWAPYYCSGIVNARSLVYYGVTVIYRPLQYIHNSHAELGERLETQGIGLGTTFMATISVIYGRWFIDFNCC